MAKRYVINVPGDKYLANRVLLLAGLAKGKSMIKNVPRNDDINHAIGALKSLGIKIIQHNNFLIIYGCNGKIKLNKTQKHAIDAGESGTLLRFMTSICALSDKHIIIKGHGSLKNRPISELCRSLNDLGARCSYNKSKSIPVKVQGPLIGGETRISGKVSSQFISSILMAAPYAKKDVEIFVRQPLVSKEYVDMTIDAMKKFGVTVERKGYRWFRVKAGTEQSYKAKNITLSSDWSNANYFLAAAAITEKDIIIKNMELYNPKGEAKFCTLLKKMGCNIRMSKSSSFIEYSGKKQCRIRPVIADMSTLPDSVPTLAVLACFADGKTTIKNIGQLRYKESNRIVDTALELKKLGIKVIAGHDYIIIHGDPDKMKHNKATLDHHNDHRMAMSFALAGLVNKNIKIKNKGCVRKSFPGFWRALEKIN